MSSSCNDPYNYTGLESDNESDSDHAWARNLALAQSRWLRPDPYDGSYDLKNPQSFMWAQVRLGDAPTLVLLHRHIARESGAFNPAPGRNRHEVTIYSPDRGMLSRGSEAGVKALDREAARKARP